MTTGAVPTRSFVAWRRLDGQHSTAFDVSAGGIGTREDWRTWDGHGLSVAVLPRRTSAADDRTLRDLPVLLLGDSAEWDPGAADRNLAGGVPIRFDPAERALVAWTSIVGLPPLFLYRGDRTLAVASDVALLRGVPGAVLELAPLSVLEVGRIGHPVAHRTLFRNLELVPSGAQLRIGSDGRVAIERAWELPPAAPLAWPQFLDAQIEAFTHGLRRVDVTESFLSLTAGLDTRTVFAALADQRRLIPAATMTGPRRSLDARTAGRLCRAYGVAHHRITFDERYVRTLPDHIESASLLSGGLASLDQAPEVYFYDRLGDGFSARLSGNLGNQVGRGGTEGISTRGAALEILAPDLRERAGRSEDESGHWLLEQLGQDDRTTLDFILTQEIPFTLVNNYPIGSHFAAQQTPYANRDLIETLARRPLERGGAPSDSIVHMRLRDLAHRFLGEPASSSFQRTLVKRIGGFAAHYPINWGWRAKGGVSPGGLVMGAATLVGMYARARGLDGGILRAPLAWAGLPALHDFRESRRWLREHLVEFTHDTVASRFVRDAGLFDATALRTTLEEHFSGRRDHYATVTFALDIALAHRQFCSGAAGAT